MKKNRCYLGTLCLAFFIIFGCRMKTADRHFDRKNYSEAIAVYKAILEKNPDSVEAMRKLGIAYYKAGEPEKSIIELTPVIKADSCDSHAVLYMGLSRLKTGEWNKGLDVLESYMDPGRPEVEKEILIQVGMLKDNRFNLTARSSEGKERLEAALKRFETAVIRAMSMRKK